MIAAVAEARWVRMLATRREKLIAIAGVALNYTLLALSNLLKNFYLGLYKLDTLWYNSEKTRKGAPICYKCT